MMLRKNFDVLVNVTLAISFFPSCLLLVLFPPSAESIFLLLSVVCFSIVFWRALTVGWNEETCFLALISFTITIGVSRLITCWYSSPIGDGLVALEFIWQIIASVLLLLASRSMANVLKAGTGFLVMFSMISYSDSFANWIEETHFHENRDAYIKIADEIRSPKAPIENGLLNQKMEGLPWGIVNIVVQNRNNTVEIEFRRLSKGRIQRGILYSELSEAETKQSLTDLYPIATSDSVFVKLEDHWYYYYGYL